MVLTSSRWPPDAALLSWRPPASRASITSNRASKPWGRAYTTSRYIGSADDSGPETGAQLNWFQGSNLQASIIDAQPLAGRVAANGLLVAGLTMSTEFSGASCFPQLLSLSLQPPISRNAVQPLSIATPNGLTLPGWWKEAEKEVILQIWRCDLPSEPHVSVRTLGPRGRDMARLCSWI
ncbi:hypothetical protein K466DRAFT_350669 [Polyporus arcularius HHB13444]|uniref:Uncharacterized protein n=1 Tax=Polyporus arcularius HHB13444 TaxID=1314778 RepID=A0A5C3PN70_9APHY|nr:hypothetical protein K466DRAFT_350669 [Polyporus arcularius HHB13444]